MKTTEGNANVIVFGERLIETYKGEPYFIYYGDCNEEGLVATFNDITKRLFWRPMVHHREIINSPNIVIHYDGYIGTNVIIEDFVAENFPEMFI